MLNYFVSYVINNNSYRNSIYGNFIHITEDELDLGENIILLQNELRSKFKDDNLVILNFKKLY